MKKVFFITAFAIGTLGCALIFHSCKSKPSKQQVEIVVPETKTADDWEDWTKVDVFYEAEIARYDSNRREYDGYIKCWKPFTDKSYQVQRRIKQGIIDYRIFLDGDWRPVTEKSKTLRHEYREEKITLHYRVLIHSTEYYFDM